MKIVSVLSLLMLISCGDLIKKMNPDPKEDNRVTAEQVEQLLSLKQDILTWAPVCAGGIACGEKDSGHVEDGDSMLWAGLLCLSGDTAQCNAVSLSQKSDGSLCRNPNCDETQNSFSRDMMLGYLASLTRSRDHSSAIATLDYIKENNYKLCTDATDNRCTVTRPQYNALWATMNKVWNHIGLEPNRDMRESDLQADEFIIHLETIFAAEGYPRHLTAVELLIRQETNSWTVIMQDAANQLVKLQPDNPFFEYVANGATKDAAQQVLNKCPRERPADPFQWAWQRDESEQAWKHSKGWDCILMVNLLTK